MKNLMLIVVLLLGGWSFSPAADAARRCSNCGVVEDVERYVERERRSSGGATVLGAVIGAVVGNQIGSGDGRKAATVAGAIAGGAIGHNAGKRRNEQVVWEFRVRMDSGRTRQYKQYDNPDQLQRGDRVIVRNGYVELF